jgi:hypothetical protein
MSFFEELKPTGSRGATVPKHIEPAKAQTLTYRRRHSWSLLQEKAPQFSCEYCNAHELNNPQHMGQQR